MKLRETCALIAAGSLAALATSAAMADDAMAEKRKKMFEETEIVAHMGLDVPSREFKDDGNPKTLEVVFLEKKKDGPSRVSDDGEVIFLYRPSDKVQQELTMKAFEIRLARLQAQEDAPKEAAKEDKAPTPSQ